MMVFFFVLVLFLGIFLKEHATLKDLRQITQKYLIEMIYQKNKKSMINW